VNASPRIPTTHTGSLPRGESLEALLLAREAGEPVDEERFDAAVDEAVRDVVARQIATGLDIVNDGEQHKPSYATYVVDRLHGFGDRRRRTFPTRRDSSDFPRWAKANAPRGLAKLRVPTCVAPLSWRDRDAVHADIERLRRAYDDAHRTRRAEGGTGIDDAGAHRQAFVTAASPGTIAMMLPNEHYDTDEAYLRALGSLMRHEYEAITSAGFLLQVDCPDLAAGYNSEFSSLSATAFLDVAAMHVDVLDEAISGIDPSRMRMHVCWGNYDGPHNHDLPLADLLPVLLAARPDGLSFEAANPRHAHEWAVWRDVELPGATYLIPGMLDTTTNYVEHPELVAERLLRYASIVGADRVVAGADCGFGTMVGLAGVHPDVAWAKLGALVEGTRLANDRLA
jgi:5-methyltetrahydropteroyltriglutamate--homocysteine methyltransferase